MRDVAALVATVILTMPALGGGRGSASPATTEAVVPVLSAGETAPAEPSGAEVAIAWTETFFPGPGAITGLASSIHGTAALGRRELPGGESFVWTRSTGSDEWVGRTLEPGS